ncbi:MAG TPA: hypothetical protein VE178_11755 [Silvibacterium sp.]|jgi:hypothetical protein|nr:hypothetical protein [Silvibacterium sp.]
MRRLCLKFAVTLLAATGCTLAQNATPNAEQIETGRVRLPSGAEVVYRIRLLPLASFPALPPAISAQLDDRKCMVPQTYEAHAPENVVHASLERKGSSDWAVLCSVNGATTLYVFFQSQPGTPIALRHQRDTEWLGSEVLGAYGSAWGISRRAPSQIRGPSPERARIDHDGIEDAFVEKSSTTHYFQDGSWITLETSN